MATCIHDGTPARHLLWLSRDRCEPICTDCADAYKPERTTDTCDCDEGHVCDYHRATNTLPERG